MLIDYCRCRGHRLKAPDVTELQIICRQTCVSYDLRAMLTAKGVDGRDDHGGGNDTPGLGEVQKTSNGEESHGNETGAHKHCICQKPENRAMYRFTDTLLRSGPSSERKQRV